MQWFVRWWRQPDHFDWLSGYLQARGLTRATQNLLATVSASLVLITANSIWGPPSLNRPFVIAVGVVAAVVGLTLAALWLNRWPTPRQSLAFGLTASLCAGLGCLAQANAPVAVLGCTALALGGGYIALFHTAPYMVLNFAMAATIAAVGALRVANESGLMLAASTYFLVIELNIAVPLAIQIVVRALGIDLIQSDRDPLTGLLNRRAFQHAVVGALLAHRGTDEFLALAMVDLDRFKIINDTQGHGVGDAVLVSVSHAIRNNVGENAVIGRVGGEEFLIADVVSTAVPSVLGQGLCRAIAAIPFSVTASVGTATVAMHTVGIDEAIETYHRLVADADDAMYAAKRGGGNRVHHRDPV